MKHTEISTAILNTWHVLARTLGFVSIVGSFVFVVFAIYWFVNKQAAMDAEISSFEQKLFFGAGLVGSIVGVFFLRVQASPTEYRDPNN